MFVQYGVRLYLVLIPIAGLGWLVYACRWRLLLQPLGLKPPFRELVADSLVGLFFGLFIPTGLTGDAMRAFRLGRRHDALRRTFVSVVLDRVVSLVSVMLLFGIQAARSGSTWRGVRLSWAGWAVLAALVMGAALVLVGRDLSDRRPVVRTRRWKMGGWLERWPFSWLLRQVGQLWDIAGEYARARRLVGLSLGVSVVYQLVVTSAYFVGGTMLGIEVAFGDYVWIVAFVMMAQVLPITIAGIGVREGLFAFLLGQYGVPTTTAVALSLVVFSVTLLFGIVGGILGLVSDTGLASGDLAPD